MNITLTDAIVAGNLDREDLAKLFHLSESEVIAIQQENDRLLNDEEVTEEEYREWCETIDKQHITI